MQRTRAPLFYLSFLPSGDESRAMRVRAMRNDRYSSCQSKLRNQEEGPEGIFSRKKVFEVARSSWDGIYLGSLKLIVTCVWISTGSPLSR